MDAARRQRIAEEVAHKLRGGEPCTHVTIRAYADNRGPISVGRSPFDPARTLRLLPGQAVTVMVDAIEKFEAVPMFRGDRVFVEVFDRDV